MNRYPNMWFVGIGISKYISYTDLPNAVRDVSEISKLLEDQYAYNKIKLLYNEDATRSGIISLLEKLAAEVTQQDSLVIYYAGHGEPGRKNKSYWLPHNSEPSNVHSWLRAGTIIDILDDIDVKHLLLLCDSCFAGGLIEPSLYRSAISNENRMASKKESRWFVCSGSSTQLVVDGKIGEYSPFAKTILDTLKDPEMSEVRVSTIVENLKYKVGGFYKQDITASPMPRLGDNNGMLIFKRISDDEKLWRLTINEHTIEAFEFYIKSFPNGKYVLAANRYVTNFSQNIKKEASTPDKIKEIVSEKIYRIEELYDVKWLINNFNTISIFDYNEVVESAPENSCLPSIFDIKVLINEYNAEDIKDIEIILRITYDGYIDNYGQKIGKGAISGFWLSDPPDKINAYACLFNRSLKKAYIRKLNRKCKLFGRFLKK